MSLRECGARGRRGEKGNIANELPQVVVREDGKDDDGGGDDDADDDDEAGDGLRPLVTASGSWGEIVRVERIFSTADEEDWPA